MDKAAGFREQCRARLQYERKLKKKKREKKASEQLDEMVSLEKIAKNEAKYKHKYNIPSDYDVYDIQEEIDWHNNFYEEEGINAPKFNDKLFPIAGNGFGDSIVVDRRNGKETLKFFSHEDPEGELHDLTDREMMDFGLIEFKPSEIQQKLIDNNVLSEDAVMSMDKDKLKQYMSEYDLSTIRDKSLKEKVKSAIAPTVYGGTVGLVSTGFFPQNKITPKLVGKMTGAGAAIGTGLGIANHISDKKYKNEVLNNILNRTKTGLVHEVRELNRRGYEPTKTASECLDELVKEAGIVNHASKAVNGIKRTGQLLTGSKARKLNNNLKTLNNTPATNFKDSVKLGEKMMNTQKALNSELGKVKKARMATVGVGVGAAGASSILNSKKGEQNV